MKTGAQTVRRNKVNLSRATGEVESGYYATLASAAEALSERRAAMRECKRTGRADINRRCLQRLVMELRMPLKDASKAMSITYHYAHMLVAKIEELER